MLLSGTGVYQSSLPFLDVDDRVLAVAVAHSPDVLREGKKGSKLLENTHAA
jgi:hypothetical protein